MKIKICGLTEKREAAYLNENQVALAGFVLFFPKSKRDCPLSRAKEIMAELSPDIRRAAVVVSPTLDQVEQIQEAGFHYIQIHGKLSQEVLSHISLPILKAFNVSDIGEYESYRANPKIAGYVFDAAEPGSGNTFNWDLIRKIPRDGKLLFLAGGLRPDNVSRAIQAVRPDGVDVSSGVEYGDRPGKDPEKIRQFVSAVRNTSL